MRCTFAPITANSIQKVSVFLNGYNCLLVLLEVRELAPADGSPHVLLDRVVLAVKLEDEDQCRSVPRALVARVLELSDLCAAVLVHLDVGNALLQIPAFIAGLHRGLNRRTAPKGHSASEGGHDVSCQMLIILFNINPFLWQQA